MIQAIMAAVFVLVGGVATASELRIGTASEPTFIDPHAADLGPNNDVRLHIFDSLIRIGANEELHQGLALSWQIVEAPLLWEFRLRPGVRFHDGASMTAHDVAFSIQRAPPKFQAPQQLSAVIYEMSIA